MLNKIREQQQHRQRQPTTQQNTKHNTIIAKTAQKQEQKVYLYFKVLVSLLDIKKIPCSL